MIPKGSIDEEVNGVDTIQDIVGSMPKEIHISYDLEYKQQRLSQGWNQAYIAIIPYCFKCKIPLVWHLNPKGVLFHCPNCNTKWIKGEGWEFLIAKPTKGINKDISKAK